MAGKNALQIHLAKSQEEEMVTIEFLARASYSLFRDDFHHAIIGHLLWDSMKPFNFTLHHCTFMSRRCTKFLLHQLRWPQQHAPSSWCTFAIHPNVQNTAH